MFDVLWFLHSIERHIHADRYKLSMSQKTMTISFLRRCFISGTTANPLPVLTIYDEAYILEHERTTYVISALSTLTNGARVC